MKLTAKDLLDLKIIDEIIPEPVGGAHRDKDLILESVKNSIENYLQKFNSMGRDEVLSHRKNKFLSIGRTRGFINNSEDIKNLSMQQNFIDNLKNRIVKNMKFFSAGIIFLFIAIFAYFL